MGGVDASKCLLFAQLYSLLFPQQTLSQDSVESSMATVFQVGKEDCWICQQKRRGRQGGRAAFFREANQDDGS